MGFGYGLLRARRTKCTKVCGWAACGEGGGASEDSRRPWRDWHLSKCSENLDKNRCPLACHVAGPATILGVKGIKSTEWRRRCHSCPDGGPRVPSPASAALVKPSHYSHCAQYMLHVRARPTSTWTLPSAPCTPFLRPRAELRAEIDFPVYFIQVKQGGNRVPWSRGLGLRSLEFRSFRVLMTPKSFGP